jgi:hypothetical protein
MTPRRLRRLVVAALVAALALAGGPPAAAEREPARGRPPQAELEAAERPFLPGLAADWGGKRVPGRSEDGRRAERIAPAGLRAPEEPTRHGPTPGDAPATFPGPLVRWCLSHSTSTASP